MELMDSGRKKHVNIVELTVFPSFFAIKSENTNFFFGKHLFNIYSTEGKVTEVRLWFKAALIYKIHPKSAVHEKHLLMWFIKTKTNGQKVADLH